MEKEIRAVDAKGREATRPKGHTRYGGGGRLVTEFNRNPDWVWRLKAVVRRRQESKHAFDVRVFDDVEAATKKVKVRNYTSLDEHPELILYEGWFDKETTQVQLEEKKAA